MSGDNPMLSKAAPTGAMTADTTPPPMRGRGGGNAGGLGIGRGALPPAPTRLINLQGLPQVIGLALGAPEFQRR